MAPEAGLHRIFATSMPSSDDIPAAAGCSYPPSIGRRHLAQQATAAGHHYDFCELKHVECGSNFMYPHVTLSVVAISCCNMPAACTMNR